MLEPALFSMSSVTEAAYAGKSARSSKSENTSRGPKFIELGTETRFMNEKIRIKSYADENR